jgi:DNA polymerase-3 subunit beta
MKIECIQERLMEAVSTVEKITGKNASLPILSSIVIEADKNNLTLKSTNLDLGIEILVPAKIDEPGTVAVSGTILSTFLSGVAGEKIKMELKDSNLKISTSKNNTTIKVLPIDDFPMIPRVEGDSFELDGKQFVKGLKSVWYSASTSGVKPELSSVYIYCEEGYVVFAATDSFRLAEKKVKIKKSKDFGAILIPFKNVSELVRVIEKAEGDVKVTLSKNQISCEFENVYMVSRVVDGVFPDYRQIIPKESKTSVVVLKQDLIQALKISNIFSDKFNQVHIKVSDTVFEITTKNNDIGDTLNQVEAVTEGEPIEVNFNQKYITDCFQSIETDSLSLTFNGPNKPVVIRSVPDSAFVYIVMPMNR